MEKVQKFSLPHAFIASPMRSLEGGSEDLSNLVVGQQRAILLFGRCAMLTRTPTGLFEIEFCEF